MICILILYVIILKILKNLKDDLINLNDLYDEFKIWYEDAFGNHKYPPKTEFKKYLIKNPFIILNTEMEILRILKYYLRIL